MSTISNSRAAKIQNILDNRKPLADRTGKKIEHLLTLKQVLGEFQGFFQKIQGKINDDNGISVLHSLKNELNIFLSDHGTIGKCLTDLMQLKARFGRPTLNIGIVGNAGHGKSTFLQALTGLTSREIPSGDKGHCTGAPSIVINHSKPETYAILEFYTEQEFIEDVIYPYYDALDLGPKPATFRDFCSSRLPDFKGGVTSKTLYDRLKDRRDRKVGYEKFLGKDNERIEQSRIRESIAQEDTNGAPFAKWIAVKMATIYCPFPKQTEEIGNVSVCDTPGLGDFVCGAEDKLVQTIGDNLEAVFMLKRPSKMGRNAAIHPEDTNLYDLLPKAISEFSPADWSYFIINKDSESVAATNFQAALDKSDIATRMTVTVDCTESKDVVEAFDQIVDDIAGNQRTLDDRLYKSRFQSVEDLIREIRDFLQKTKDLLSRSIMVEDSLSQYLHQWFGECWEIVEGDVVRIAAERRKRYELPEPQHEETGKGPETIRELKTIHNGYETQTFSATGRAGWLGSKKEKQTEISVPNPTDLATSAYLKKLDQIKQRLLKRDPFAGDSPKQYAGKELTSFFTEKAQNMRVELSMEFDDLNDELAADCMEIRRSIWQILIDEKKGKLGRVLTMEEPRQENELEADAWLRQLSMAWKGRPGGERIHWAIQRLLTTTISFRGILLPEIREQYSLLCCENTEEEGFWARFFPQDQAPQKLTYESGRKNLMAAWKKTIENCYNELSIIALKLELAKVAVIEDFCDNFFRAYGHTETRGHWLAFYQEHKTTIWQNEFAGVKENRLFHEEGNRLIEFVRTEIEHLKQA